MHKNDFGKETRGFLYLISFAMALSNLIMIVRCLSSSSKVEKTIGEILIDTERLTHENENCKNAYINENIYAVKNKLEALEGNDFIVLVNVLNQARLFSYVFRAILKNAKKSSYDLSFSSNEAFKELMSNLLVKLKDNGKLLNGIVAQLDSDALLIVVVGMLQYHEKNNSSSIYVNCFYNLTMNNLKRISHTVKEVEKANKKNVSRVEKEAKKMLLKLGVTSKKFSEKHVSKACLDRVTAFVKSQKHKSEKDKREYIDKKINTLKFVLQALTEKDFIYFLRELSDQFSLFSHIFKAIVEDRGSDRISLFFCSNEAFKELISRLIKLKDNGKLLNGILAQLDSDALLIVLVGMLQYHEKSNASNRYLKYKHLNFPISQGSLERIFYHIDKVEKTDEKDLTKIEKEVKSVLINSGALQR